jgi:hypothetical protein
VPTANPLPRAVPVAAPNATSSTLTNVGAPP